MLFIDRKEAALIMALMPVLASCSSKETPVASIPTLPTSTPVSETATPTPKSPTATPIPPTATPEPKPQVKLPGERGMTYIAPAGLRERNIAKGGFFLTITPEGTTPEGIVVGFSTVQNCSGQPTRASEGFFIEPGNPRVIFTERSIRFERPNAQLDTVMPASETRFFGNFKLFGGGGCDEQQLNFIADPTTGGLSGIENAALQILRAIEMKPGSANEATETLFRTCRQCQTILNAMRTGK